MKMIKHEKPQHALTSTENKAKVTHNFSNLSKVKLTCTDINWEHGETDMLFQ